MPSMMVLKMIVQDAQQITQLQEEDPLQLTTAQVRPR